MTKLRKTVRNSKDERKKKSNEGALVYPSRLLREKSLKRVFKGLLLFLMFVEDVLVLFEILFIA